MLKYIYQTLLFFRNAFATNFKWLMFCPVITGFAAIPERGGVASFCRFGSLDTAHNAFTPIGTTHKELIIWG